MMSGVRIYIMNMFLRMISLLYWHIVLEIRKYQIMMNGLHIMERKTEYIIRVLLNHMRRLVLMKIKLSLLITLITLQKKLLVI